MVECHISWFRILDSRRTFFYCDSTAQHVYRLRFIYRRFYFSEEILWKAAPQRTNSRKTWEIGVKEKPVGAPDFDLKGKWRQNIIGAHRYKRNVAPILPILYCLHSDAFDFNYYAALLPRRGPHIASHSVCPSVCLSVCLPVCPSVRPSRYRM